MANNKTCILCHKTYKHCGHCKSESAFEPSWKSAWDTEECMNIFQILANYNNGAMTASEAKKELIKYDLKDKDSYSPKMKKAAEEIMAAEIPAEPEKVEDLRLKDMKIIEVKPEDLENKSERQPKKQEFIAKRSMKKSNK